MARDHSYADPRRRSYAVENYMKPEGGIEQVGLCHSVMAVHFNLLGGDLLQLLTGNGDLRASY